ncbi:unnamed protein product [Leuciscus chuanchicus]
MKYEARLQPKSQGSVSDIINIEELSVSRSRLQRYSLVLESNRFSTEPETGSDDWDVQRVHQEAMEGREHLKPLSPFGLRNRYLSRLGVQPVQVSGFLSCMLWHGLDPGGGASLYSTDWQGLKLTPDGRALSISQKRHRQRGRNACCRTSYNPQSLAFCPGARGQLMDLRPDLAEEELKSFQRVKCLNNGGYELQNHQMATDMENNITVNTHPLETTVLIMQHDWREFLQTQDILEKRSPSPSSLMSSSLSMATLSDGSTPVSPAPSSMMSSSLSMATLSDGSTPVSPALSSLLKPGTGPPSDLHTALIRLTTSCVVVVSRRRSTIWSGYGPDPADNIMCCGRV